MSGRCRCATSPLRDSLLGDRRRNPHLAAPVLASSPIFRWNTPHVQYKIESSAHQESMGGGFSASMGGASGSFSYSRGNASGNYAGVVEQAGIQAGSGGFDINVAGNTDLKGSYIASTADPSKNQLTTGTLTYPTSRIIPTTARTALALAAGARSATGAPTSGRRDRVRARTRAALHRCCRSPRAAASVA